MRFLDCNRMAGAALTRYPGRTFMMLLATAIGVAAVLVLTSLGEAARRYVSGEFQALGTHLVIAVPGRSETTGMGPGMFISETPRDLTVDDARAVLRSPYVERVAPVIVGASTVSRGGLERDITVLGTTAEMRPIRQWKMKLGEFLPNVGLENAAPVCVVGLTVAEGGSVLLYLNSDVDPTVLYRLDTTDGSVITMETVSGLIFSSAAT